MTKYILLHEKTDGYGSHIKEYIMRFYSAKKADLKIKFNELKSNKNKVLEKFIDFKSLCDNIDDTDEFTDIHVPDLFDIEDYYRSLAFETIRSKVDTKEHDKTLNGKINIGVHVRRGDVYYRSIESNYYRNKYYKGTNKQGRRIKLGRRFTKNEIFIGVINYLNTVLPSDKIVFHIFSVGEPEEFKEFDCIKNKILHISPPNEQETYHKTGGEYRLKELMSTMINCDILLCSKSSLSLACAFLSKGVIFMPSWSLARSTIGTYHPKWIGLTNYKQFCNELKEHYETINNKIKHL